MSAPSWLLRPQEAPAVSPCPTPYLPAPSAGGHEVRPLFPRSAHERRPPAAERGEQGQGEHGAAVGAAALTAAEPRHQPAPAAAQPVLQHDEVAARVGKALASLEELQQHVIVEARADAVELAIALVKNLVGVIDGVSVDKLLEVAREALAAAGPTANAVVRVHPDDLAVMRAASLHSGEGAPVEVRADAALGKGDLVVDTSAGRIDGSRRARLAQLERSVRSNMGAAGDGAGRNLAEGGR